MMTFETGYEIADASEIDDLDTMHPIDCNCEDCVENLILELNEDRAA